MVPSMEYIAPANTRMVLVVVEGGVLVSVLEWCVIRTPSKRGSWPIIKRTR